jgi:hypothetical protein
MMMIMMMMIDGLLMLMMTVQRLMRMYEALKVADANSHLRRSEV